ncbi:MDR family oxidoreductase [Acuticoccus sp. MNP-M23]|uniref:MDR family oxidoreductase n=1 Tax=Acuticoccus sp. MNP-M23 TaxID=3072793 RepID=UPI002814CC3A|nr:MDR family oxidoreductase [Acuticoccus sp. MNP-M23]WMS44730.1 MDR family oxidoreductase [Acuticoccus sp. MNP-M23]
MRALIVEKQDDAVSATIQTIDESRLPAGEPGDQMVTVKISHTTVNYKDGLCVTGTGGLVRNFPHVPGIDFAGTVETSDDPRYKPGDAVVLTGWRVGEAWWGGYAEKARVKGDWLVPLPDGLTARQAMAVGTAGFTAMLAVMALERHGLKTGGRPVLVTGASGGVGSVAVAILSRLGHDVAAVTGRPEQADYLSDLGATSIVPRADLAEAPSRPLGRETYAGCIDAVGGAMLSHALTLLEYGGSAAAVGLAGGAKMDGATVVPFLLRGINLLGIDSVMQPRENRLEAWTRVARDLPMEKLEAMIVPATLDDVPELAEDILKGKVRGRVVVEV